MYNSTLRGVLHFRHYDGSRIIMTWLALDIGGANLKLADGRGFAASYSFALWKDYQRLAMELRGAIAESPACDHLAVTMTGELADCFASKAEGVRFILQAVREAADHRHTRVYLHDGRLVAPQIALTTPELAASSNWHALARYCGRFTDGAPALMIDVGSTTVDVVPLHDGQPACVGFTDLERLAAGELIYTGVERSPVCGVVHSLPYGGQRCPVAQEVFATTRDVHLLLGNLPEDPRDHHTADHQPATVAAAHRRLARMLCADQQQLALDVVQQWAREIAEAQLQMVLHGVTQVLQRGSLTPTKVIVAGHGEFLARQLLAQLPWQGEVISLTDKLHPSVSRCAPAHALAVLAREL